MTQGSIKNDKAAAVAKAGSKVAIAAAEPGDDEALLLGDEELVTMNTYEEDPVNTAFEMHTTCAPDDKKREANQKSQRKKEIQLLFEKLRKVQDSLDKKNADFKEQIRF